MTRKRTLVIGLLVAGVLFVGGAGVVFLQVNAAHSAVSTTGTIQSAQVDKYTPVKRRPVIGNTQYRANVTYTYSVQGKKYTSNRVFPGHYTAYATEKPIAKVANTYHHGEPVTVYYSPSNPSASYLVNRYAFVPGFLAMVIAPYIAAVLLTPGFGWMGIVRQIVRQSLNDLRRTSTSGIESSRRRERHNGLNDDQLFGTDRTSNSLSLSGWLEWATWTAATVIALAVVGLYVLLSGSAYSRMAYLVAFLVVVITVVRMGFRYQFS